MEKTVFRATHDETGMELTGDAHDLAEKLGVALNTVYKYVVEGKKVSGHWRIKKITEPEVSSSYCRMSENMRKQWDEVTKPFKDASKRALKQKGE